MNKKKGVFFTLDAILAAGIFLIVILAVSTSYVSQPETAPSNFFSHDITRIFANLKVNDLDNNYVKSLINSNKITRANNTILEQIGEFWAEEQTELAKNLSKNVSDALIPARFGIGIYVDGEEIYARKNNMTRNLVSSRKIISGIAKQKPTEGFTSRAILGRITAKTNTKFYPFDVTAPCYNSWYDNSNADKISIEKTIELPNDANVTNATWIIMPAIADTSVKAYINGNLVFNGIPDLNGIKNAQGNFTSGINKVKYEQTVTSYGGCAGDDGTSHVILTYKTQQFQTIDNKTNFPFAVVYADGRISDYEKPIFVPNTDITKINISLKVKADNVNLNFRFKGTEFNIGRKQVFNNLVEWKNSEILGNLTQNGISYSNLKDNYFYFVFDFIPVNNNVTVFPNSTVTVEGLKEDIPFGSIDISQAINLASQSNPTGWSWCPSSYYNANWNFNLPNSATHAYSDWLIGWCMQDDADQIARANGINLYRHIENNPATDPFINSFARFGYTKNVAAGSVITGQNTFSLQFGSDYSTKPVISYGENVFYIPHGVSYTTVLKEAKGCVWKVDTNAGIKTIKVPKGYSGNNNCAYNKSAVVYAGNDSLQIAALGIFQLLDFDDDGMVDVLVSDTDIEIETNVISKVPSLWGPSIVEIRVWE
ncbi:hypothetical protein HYX01_04015 [Candidatus Woesearchaeota archaeon]|nr:hypothetical protein [Candidatus Woesearchaeota archaeon]